MEKHLQYQQEEAFGINVERRELERRGLSYITCYLLKNLPVKAWMAAVKLLPFLESIIWSPGDVMDCT